MRVSHSILARIQAILPGLALFLLNFYICHDLFRTEYHQFMGSIEGEFIGISRYEITHWNDLTWFALWNGGTPFTTTYPPLLHLVVAFCSWLSGASVAHTYHWITALAYCLGPVALYALILRLSRSRWAGFVAGLLYSCVATCYWILPVIGRDLGSPFYSRRFQALVMYGEGPHVSSMTLLTLAVLFVHLAMTRRRPWWTLLAALFLAATATTNWLGAFATVLFLGPYVLSQLGDIRPAEGEGTEAGWKWRDIGRFALIGVAAYCLAMPLMPPSTIAVLQANAKTTGGDYTSAYGRALPQSLAVLVALLAIKAAVRRWPRHLQFATILAFLVTFVAAADQLWNISIVPMAFRYQLEMEMTLAMLAAMAALALLRGRTAWAPGVVVAVLVLALIQPIRIQRHHVREMLVPIDITRTIEYREADWLNKNWPGGRVFLSGSVGFWLTAFSDTPQLLGFPQATTNQMNRIAEYVLYTGDPTGAHETDSAILWLKALGVGAVSISGSASREAYKGYAKPWKFEGALEPLWRDGDDVVYKVGGPASLARMVPRSSLVPRPPKHGLDLEPLRPYVSALDDPQMPQPEFHWTSAHSATASSKFDPDLVMSIQIAWDRGWSAKVNGRATAVLRDEIGQMYIDPKISGPGTVEMTYDGGFETRAAFALSFVAALPLVAASIRGALKRTPVT